MARRYRMAKRMAARDETRERILRATVALHDEQGVAATTFADVARRAGVGPATVLRHFPTVGALVSACGAHVAEEMRPPAPEDAARLFEDLAPGRDRIERLVGELCAFYARGALRLEAAGRDRHRIPELDGFLRRVDAGIEAMIRAALGPEPADRTVVGVVMALCGFGVWQSMRQSGLPETEHRRILGDLIGSAVASAGARPPAG